MINTTHIHNLTPWYSFDNNNSYNKEDYFIYPEFNEEWKSVLYKNYEIIQSEFNNLLKNKDKSIVPYFNKTLANNSENWTVFPLKFCGNNLKNNQTKCPRTSEILNQIPNTVNVAFSILRPGTIIKPHLGDTNVYTRFHFGLNIPSDISSCQFEINGNSIPWKKNNIFGFIDAQKHAAYNKTNETRVILILDIVRPQFKNQSTFIKSKLLGIALIQNTFQKFNIIVHLPKFIRGFISNILGFYIYLFRRLFN